MDKNKFIEELQKLNITLSLTQLVQFETYFNILVTENEKYNLTAITEEEEVYYKHFFDCLTVNHLIKDNSSICDIGSGAGFPAIPLLIVNPSLKVTIIDSLGKRIKFLDYLVKELDLNNVTLIHGRAEEVIVDYRESFDIVCARAVANLNVLSELCIPYLKIDGLFIALKGNAGLEEDVKATKAIKTLKCKLISTEHVELPLSYGARYNLVYQKYASCDKIYPRVYGQIKKFPLGV